MGHSINAWNTVTQAQHVSYYANDFLSEMSYLRLCHQTFRLLNDSLG